MIVPGIVENTTGTIIVFNVDTSSFHCPLHNDPISPVVSLFNILYSDNLIHLVYYRIKFSAAF